MPDAPIPDAGEAFAAAIDATEPGAPTACAGWTAHDIRAHMTAAFQEVSELLEDSNAGRPARPTRTFDEREPYFQAMPDEQLREATAENLERSGTAMTAFAQRGPTTTFDFTGRPFTLDQLLTHAQSESAIHRWDFVGDDDISSRLLAQPGLTRHAVSILDTMPVLQEFATSRATQGGLHDVTIVLRSPGEPDVVLEASDGAASFRVSDSTVDGDAVLTTDAGNRLLTIWGRRSSHREIDISGNPALWEVVRHTLWPAAVTWPLTSPTGTDGV
jgi:hypothetical protein